MATLEEQANRIFIKLTDEPPTAMEQARLMADAFKATVEKNPVMRVEKLDQRYVQITGDRSIGDKTITGYLHRAGEAVTFDAINSFFEDPLVQEKWGGRAVEITASVLIPANVLDDRQVLGSMNDMEKQVFLQAKNEWSDVVEGKSITDFLMKNAYPIESKAKLNERIFLTREGATPVRASDPNRVRAKNPYIEKLGKMGGKTVVGSILFDVFFEHIASSARKELEETVLKEMKTEAQKSSNQLVVTDMDFSGLETKGRLFKIVSMRINMFVPAVVDDKNFEEWLAGQVITSADLRANRVVAEFTTEMMDRIVNEYRNT